MDTSGDQDRSVTIALANYKQGDLKAAEEIWQRFFHRVCGLAKKKLGDVRKRVVDEEDIAQSAMHALYQGIQDNRFERLENRDDLWQLLVMLTSRKAALVWRKQGRRKEAGESVFAGSDETAAAGLQAIIDAKPTQPYVDQLCESCDERLSTLEPKLREVAVLKLQGFTNEEISEQVDRSVKSVERYLKMIRLQWMQDGGET